MYISWYKQIKAVYYIGEYGDFIDFLFASGGVSGNVSCADGEDVVLEGCNMYR